MKNMLKLNNSLYFIITFNSMIIILLISLHKCCLLKCY